jgi:ribA/ribD-fused uncharacterized protein
MGRPSCKQCDGNRIWELFKSFMSLCVAVSETRRLQHDEWISFHPFNGVQQIQVCKFGQNFSCQTFGAPSTGGIHEPDFYDDFERFIRIMENPATKVWPPSHGHVTFFGKDHIFSNFYLTSVTLAGDNAMRGENIRCSTVEAAFQLGKCSNANCYLWDKIVASKTGVRAKALGRQVLMSRSAVAAWTECERVHHMMRVVTLSVLQNATKLVALMATGTRYIIENGRDDFWGNDARTQPRGRNVLGRILMKIRQILTVRLNQNQASSVSNPATQFYKELIDADTIGFNDDHCHHHTPPITSSGHCEVALPELAFAARIEPQDFKVGKDGHPNSTSSTSSPQPSLDFNDETDDDIDETDTDQLLEFNEQPKLDGPPQKKRKSGKSRQH